MSGDQRGINEVLIEIKAENSNGKHKLCLVEFQGEYWFTLTGQYKGEPIQIDFTENTRHELEEMKTAIELILEIQ